MKHIFYLLILIVVNLKLYAQVGFQKPIKTDLSNGLVGVYVKNDSILLNNIWNKDRIGFYPESILADTMGNIMIRRNNIPSDNYVGTGGLWSKTIISTSKYTLLVLATDGVKFLKFENKTFDLLYSKDYTIPDTINANYIPYSLIEIDSSYIIYGSVQFKYQGRAGGECVFF